MTGTDSDIVQRARQALDGITEGEWWWTAETRARLIAIGDDRHELTDAREIIRCAALLHPGDADASFIAAAPDLVRELVAEVEKLRAQPVELSASTLAAATAAWSENERLEGDAIRFLDERNQARAEVETSRQMYTSARERAAELRAERDEMAATLARVRALAEHWANPAIKIDGQSLPIRPEYAARVIRRALDGEVEQ